jgi:hypothetical protein
MGSSISWRQRFWLGAGLATLLTVLSTRGYPVAVRSAATLAVLLGLCVLELVGEVVWLTVQARRDRNRSIPRSTLTPSTSKMADGVVGVVEMSDTVGESNPGHEPYRRFISFERTSHSSLCRNASDKVPPLIGQVALISLFLGRDGVAWSSREIREAHRSLKRAGEWIEFEAMRWKACLDINLADVFFQAQDDTPAADEVVELEHPAVWDRTAAFSRIEPYVRFSKAAQKLGFLDAVDFTDSVRRRVKADQIVWLIHSRSAGRSIAIPGDLTEMPGVSFAVCFACENDHQDRMKGPPFVDPITVVHEVLHLFGASDKYDERLGSFPHNSVTDHDIMRLDSQSLLRLRIDPLTAYEIGWADAGAMLPPDPTNIRRIPT